MDLQWQKEEEGNKKQIRDICISLICAICNEEEVPLCTIEKIGVAVPGKVRNGIITDLWNLGIKEMNLKKELEEYFKVEVQIRNDAKCAALAEKKYGSLQEYEDCVFLCLGTGIGGATFLGGKMLEPKCAEGSEYGHMIIQKEGRPCNCGSKGCFERYGSMRAFKSGFVTQFAIKEEISSEGILQMLKQRKEEEPVKKYVKDYLHNLVVGVTNITNIVEPQAICMGGSFVYFQEIFYERFVEQMREERHLPIPKIVLAKLGNDAGMIGAIC